MTKPNVLFAVNTEFCLFVGLLYYKIHLRSDFEPIWYILSNTKNRFKDMDFSILPGQVFFYDDYLNTTKLKCKTSFLKNLKNYDVRIFVHQNNFRVSNQLIKCKLNSNKTKEVYISDGLGLSVRRSFNFMFKQSLVLNFRRFMTGIFNLPLAHVQSGNYVKKVDTYISFESLQNLNTNYISFKTLFDNFKDFATIKRLFNSEITNDYDIYFFSQPIEKGSNISKKVKKKYRKLLSFLSNAARQNKIKTMFKIHPGEKFEDYLEYKNRYCHINKSKSVPAEVLFYKLNDKKILSCFSSVSTTDFSERNQHFWLYPLINYDPNIKANKITVLSDFDSLEKLYEKSC